MDLTPEILLPDQVWFQIFKYINPKTLMKLRNVNVELMNLIEKFGGWKTLFFDSLTLAPWRNQLCGMYDPKLTRDEYDSQPDGFYKKLIAFYISWKSLGNVTERPVVFRFDDSNLGFFKCDANGNHVAGSSVSHKLVIIEGDTLVAGPIEFPKTSEWDPDMDVVSEIKIWRPEFLGNLQKRKFFVIMMSYFYMAIWDVDERIYQPLPKFIKEIYHQNREEAFAVDKLYWSENDIFIETKRSRFEQLVIAKLIWDEKKKEIDGQTVFKMTHHPGARYRAFSLNDVYTENSKIMVVFNGEGNFYFAQTDIPRGSGGHWVTSLLENSTKIKQIFHDCKNDVIHKVKIKIQNSHVVTAYNEKDFFVAIKSESQDGQFDFVTKSIYNSNQSLKISDCIFKFDVLFILTQKTKLRVYTFKNIDHLIDIDLFTDRAREIETDLEGPSEGPEVKLMTRNHMPCILVFKCFSDMKYLTF